MTEHTYTFTMEQLFRLLADTAEHAREWRDVHGYGPAGASGQAAQDTIDGLDAERELYRHGEIAEAALTQVVDDAQTEADDD